VHTYNNNTRSFKFVSQYSTSELTDGNSLLSPRWRDKHAGGSAHESEDHGLHAITLQPHFASGIKMNNSQTSQQWGEVRRVSHTI
jgi:hypothetical protein